MRLTDRDLAILAKAAESDLSLISVYTKDLAAVVSDLKEARAALLEIASLDPVEANANHARALVKLVQIAEQALNAKS